MLNRRRFLAGATSLTAFLGAPAANLPVMTESFAAPATVCPLGGFVVPPEVRAELYRLLRHNGMLTFGQMVKLEKLDPIEFRRS